MNENNLITPEEIISISGKFTIGNMKTAAKVAKMAKVVFDGDGLLWNYLRVVQCIFEAGRIQGIREERQKKKVKSGGSAK